MFVHCKECGEELNPARASLNYETCPTCGEAEARKVKHTIAPLNKSNYMLFTDPALLAQLNPKRT